MAPSKAQRKKNGDIYRYKVSNGIRVVKLLLKYHMPLHLQTALHRVLVSHPEQPTVYYICNAIDHMALHCPRKANQRKAAGNTERRKWTQGDRSEAVPYLISELLPHRGLLRTTLPCLISLTPWLLSISSVRLISYPSQFLISINIRPWMWGSPLLTSYSSPSRCLASE